MNNIIHPRFRFQAKNPKWSEGCCAPSYVGLAAGLPLALQGFHRSRACLRTGRARLDSAMEPPADETSFSGCPSWHQANSFRGQEP